MLTKPHLAAGAPLTAFFGLQVQRKVRQAESRLPLRGVLTPALRQWDRKATLIKRSRLMNGR